MPLKMPPNAQVTASEQTLKTGPSDMPAWKGSQGQEQVTASRMPLGRTAHPVANFGNHPGRHGTPQVTSSECTLSRKPSNPYGPTSKTKPEVAL